MEIPWSRAMATATRRGLAVAVGAMVMLTGWSVVPASAVPVDVTVVIQADGVPLGEDVGQMTVFSYELASKSWQRVADDGTNDSGISTVSVEPGEYRFCFEKDSDITTESTCLGNPLVSDATTVTVSGITDLGVVNLGKKTVANASGATITGRPLVGQRLTFDISSVTPDPLQTTIYWLRDAGLPASQGMPPVGYVVGEGPHYVVRDRDVGHTITAGLLFGGPTVRGPWMVGNEASFYLHMPATTIVLPAGFSGAPKMQARRWKRGAKASYVAPADVPAGVTAQFQWLRNGKAIKGQTGPTHKIARKDRKKRISLRVTYTRPGHETVTMESAPSRRVK